jgi:CRISPR-associated protein Csd1
VILQELGGLARREKLLSDPDFEPKPVRWIIKISPAGRLLGTPDDTEEKGEKGKATSKVIYVPRNRARTSGSLAGFLVDKAEYVLGFDPDDKKEKRGKLAHHRALFAEFIESALKLAADDIGLVAVLAFVRDDEQVSRCVELLGGRATANDLVAFQLLDDDGRNLGLVHDREPVRDAWKTLRGGSKGSNATPVGCVVCGTLSPPVDVHPLIKRVPGGSTSGISFVSFNDSAFESLGLEKNENAPVCRACADAYGTALNRLLHPEYALESGKVLNPRMLRLSDDTAVVYWASEESKLEDEFGELLADPEKVELLFEAVHTGKWSLLNDPTPFYALILSGAEGRATIRGYHQSTVGEIAENLRQYFDDIEIVRQYPKSPRWPPLWRLVVSLAAQEKFKNVAPDLAGRLFLSILNNWPFPRTALSAAVGRIRSEPESPSKGKHKHTQERLGLIRASINRRFRAADPTIHSLITQEVTVMLDPTCSNNAYCLGRLFAVLEKLQGEAIGNTNSTITDRFYGAASATPAAVFASLIRKSQHHLAKLKAGFSASYSKRIQEILNLLEPSTAFPTTFRLEEQGLFALGYYHQKSALYTKDKPEVEAPAEAVADPE